MKQRTFFYEFTASFHSETEFNEASGQSFCLRCGVTNREVANRILYPIPNMAIHIHPWNVSSGPYNVLSTYSTYITKTDLNDPKAKIAM